MTTTTAPSPGTTTADEAEASDLPTPAPRRRLRPLRKLLLTVVALVTLATGASLASGSPAGAATWVRGGSYGGVQLRPLGVAPIHGQYVGGIRGLAVGNVIVTRSPAAAGTQTVWRQVHIEKWVAGRWQYVWDSGLHGRYVPPGESAQLFPLYAALGPGSYRVKLYLYWRDAWNRNLGHFAAAYDHASDYACGRITCSVGSGWITI